MKFQLSAKLLAIELHYSKTVRYLDSTLSESADSLLGTQDVLVQQCGVSR